MSASRTMLGVMVAGLCALACTPQGPEKCQSDAQCEQRNGRGWSCIEKSCVATACKSDDDCYETPTRPTCDRRTGMCVSSRACGCSGNFCSPGVRCINCACVPIEPKGCSSNDDCKKDPASPICDKSTGQCIPDPACNCSQGQTCAADELCDGCICIKKPQAGDCSQNSDCSGPTPKCKEATRKCVGCLSDADCPSGETCKADRCQSCQCTSDADCAGGPRYRRCEGCRCVPDAGPNRILGVPCEADGECGTGLRCLPSNQGEAVCFQPCISDADCIISLRDRCHKLDPFDSRTSVCVGYSPKGASCGLKRANQSLCDPTHHPPLYCDRDAETCKEALYSPLGSPCNKPGDTRQPVELCDHSKGHLCDPATGTCVKATERKAAGELCDPTGRLLGKVVLCTPGLHCFSFGSEGIQSRCHQRCDPKKSGECAQGTRCLAKLPKGEGLCMKEQCAQDSDCPWKGYRCTPRQKGTSLCTPKQPTGPRRFAERCADIPLSQRCEEGLFCLKHRGPQGICTKACTTGTCPRWKDPKSGASLIATCVEINATDKACLITCGLPGDRCPTGLSCQDVGRRLCLAAP